MELRIQEKTQENEDSCDDNFHTERLSSVLFVALYSCLHVSQNFQLC